MTADDALGQHASGDDRSACRWHFSRCKIRKVLRGGRLGARSHWFSISERSYGTHLAKYPVGGQGCKRSFVRFVQSFACKGGSLPKSPLLVTSTPVNKQGDFLCADFYVAGIASTFSTSARASAGICQPASARFSSTC